ncbi:MAG: DUF6519 domain-containing protein [Lysobacterales bacterium]|jgi:hypothetical protein
MKADFTRFTFRPAKQYRTVRMQQGRVQTDADWNEQQDILNHRVETETVDSLGLSAGPIGNCGFELTGNGKDVTIGAGHYYVEGLLCENPAETDAAPQPNLPANASPVMPADASVLPLPPAKAKSLKTVQVYDAGGKPVDPPDGLYIGYLEVWERHITALEDPLIREVALGGPDTATRDQTIWQVKFLRAGESGSDVTCLSDVEAWDQLVTPPDGTLAARAQPSTPPENPCLLSPDAGYRRLENLLYRVEIHDDGSLSGKTRYKWSHDNASIATKVTRWLGNPVVDEFEVANIGRDAYLAIVPGCWVEFYDDTHELLGHPGTLVQVLKTTGNVVTLDLTTKIGSLDEDMFPSNPRVRRWDGWADASPADPDSESGWVGLEDGVEIKFAPGTFRIGDYWTIPARTATADVEWPVVGGKPVFQLPQGILRAFTRLAILSCKDGKWKRESDCRHEFPAQTELTNLFYIGGDGQEAMPNLLQPAPVSLPRPIEVAVFNGQYPVAGAEVRFTAHDGKLSNGGSSQTVVTNADGIAAASWSLAPDKPSQTALAELLEEGQPAAGKYNEIHFSAQLSIAAQVAYDPASCPGLKAKDIHTVQAAIDALCQNAHGGGCCTTVGKDGEYPTLDKALLALIEQGATDICLCLLPGTHRLEGDLSLKAPERVHLHVHGAGRASRVWLRNQGFKLVDFASVTLTDFDLQCIDGTLSVFLHGCNDVRLANMHIAGITQPGASLVSISDALNIEISNTELRSFLREGLGKAAKLLAKAAVLKPLVESLQPDKGELHQPLDVKLAEKLSGLSASRRKAAVTQINTLLRATDEPLLQDAALQRAFVRVRNQLARPGEHRKFTVALEGLRAAAVMLQPGFALALDSPDAVTAVTGSLIMGRFSLYGESTAGRTLPQTMLKPLGAGLRRGAFRLVPGTGDLRLLANHLMDVRLSDAFAAKLKEILGVGEGAVEDCYRSLVAADNEWLASNNEAIAIDLGLSMNALHLKGDFGACISNQAKYIGNFAHDDFRLFNVGSTAEKFGNGGLNIIDLV